MASWQSGYYNGDDDSEFEPLRLGIDVYNRRSYTGRNRSPIDDLVAITTGTLKTDPDTLPFEADALAKSLVCTGSVALLNPLGEASLMADVYCPNDAMIVQYLRAKDGYVELHMRAESMDDIWTDPLRIYTRGEAGWSWQLWRDWGDPSRQCAEGEAVSVDGGPDAIHAFPNGRGILYWAQDTYNRMEENARTQAKVMRGANTLPMLSGNTGNAQKIGRAFAEAVNAIVLPGNVEVHRVVSDSVIAQLVAEAAERKDDYLNALNVVDNESVNRPVVGDSMLRRWAMTEYIKGLQRKLTQLYAAMGAAVEFGRLRTASIEDIAKEIETVALYQSKGAAALKAAELLG